MSTNKRSLGMPLEIARQKVLEDPIAQEMAQVLGMTIEAFADQVLEAAQDPESVQLEVMTDEEAAEFGDQIPSEAEVVQWLEAVAEGEIDLSGPEAAFSRDAVSSDFEQEKARRGAGFEAQLAAPSAEAPQRQVVVAADDPMGSVLKQQLLSERARSNFTTPAPRKKAKPRSGPGR